MTDQTTPPKLRRLAARIIRDVETLQSALVAALPGVMEKSGNDDPAPEVYIGLGQALVYAEAFLGISDEGLRDMIDRHGSADR